MTIARGSGCHDGQLRYHHNFVGVIHTTITSDTALPAGAHQVGLQFAYDGGGLGKGAEITLQLDGEPIDGGRVERTHGIFFSMDETADIGRDAGAPVSPDYGPRDNEFNGTVNWVQIDITDTASDADHLLANHDRFHHAAMAKQ